MKNVIQFPTQSVIDWLTIERSMNVALDELAVSEIVRKRLLGTMKAFYQETLSFQFNLSRTAAFPSTLSASEVTSICSKLGTTISASSSEQLQSFTKALFFERLNREIELCRELGLLP